MDAEPKKRSKESYVRKEVREDRAVLIAVIKTMLDLFPDLPKAQLIKLKPVRVYANGSLYTEETLINIVSEVDKKERKAGRLNSEALEKMKEKIPAAWRKEIDNRDSCY